MVYIIVLFPYNHLHSLVFLLLAVATDVCILLPVSLFLTVTKICKLAKFDLMFC